MLAFSDFRVVSFTREFFDLHWEIEPTLDDIQEWEFYVDRSESEAGSWTEIAGPLIDQFFLRDNTVAAYNDIRTWFYRVRAHHVREGFDVVSDTADQGGPIDLMGAEVTRVETLVWKEHNGVALWVFPRRTFGQRCPSCYDDVLQKVTEADCELCWGTGFTGGYHRPIKTWGQVQPSEIRQHVSTEDHKQPITGNITCPPSPTIRPGDLIVDARNWRWVATAQDATTRLQVDVRQIVPVFKVEPGQIEDHVPLRVDAAVEELRGPRNFSNPQDLEAANSVDLSDLDDLLGTHRY